MLTDIKYVLTFETNSFRNKVICRNFEKPLAGDEGFEPPILGPEPSALPLGQSPML